MPNDLQGIGKLGPCLLHGDYHRMAPKCWRVFTTYLHECETSGRTDPTSNVLAYRRAVEAKMKKKGI